MKFKLKLLSNLKKPFFGVGFLLLIFSSIISLYNSRDLVKTIITKPIRTIDKDYSPENKKDKEWSKKIMKGGYILHFRHAERDKWIDVQMYDALESDVHKNGINQSRYAENDYFKDAVCLNERGMIQARAMGEHLSNISFPSGYVVSSPSCRSRQTADLVFGGYDSLNRVLVHDGPYLENTSERSFNLISYYLDLPIEKTKNTIVSAHNSVIRSSMLANNNDPNLSLEEGGFYVLSKKDGKLYLEHEFHNFNDFIKNFYIR